MLEILQYINSSEKVFIYSMLFIIGTMWSIGWSISRIVLAFKGIEA